jgi:hypothetical protein
LRLHIQRLPLRGQLQRDTDFAHRSDHDRHVGTGLRETGCAHDQSIVARQQIVEAEFSAAIALGLTCKGRLGGLQGNIRGLEAAATGIGDGARQAAAEILGMARKREDDGDG